MKKKMKECFIIKIQFEEIVNADNCGKNMKYVFIFVLSKLKNNKKCQLHKETTIYVR